MAIDNITPSSSDLLEALTRFGLSQYQARIYLHLLSLGPSTAGPLVRKSGLHRQFVYSSLEILEEQGIVSHVLKSNRKVFLAARPEVFLEREGERLRSLQLALPKLISLIPQASKGVRVEVLTGREDFIRRLYTVVDSAARGDRMIRVIAGVRDVDVYAVIGNRYKEYVDYTKQKKVRKHLIAPKSSSSTAYDERFLKERGNQLRLSDAASSVPTATHITKELVAFDVFAEEVISVLIWNSSLAKSYTEHFEVLWKAAIPYFGSSGSKGEGGGVDTASKKLKGAKKKASKQANAVSKRLTKR